MRRAKDVSSKCVMVDVNVDNDKLESVECGISADLPSHRISIEIPIYGQIGDESKSRVACLCLCATRRVNWSQTRPIKPESKKSKNNHSTIAHKQKHQSSCSPPQFQLHSPSEVEHTEQPSFGSVYLSQHH